MCQDVTLEMLRAPETLVTKLALQRLVSNRVFSHVTRSDLPPEREEKEVRSVRGKRKAHLHLLQTNRLWLGRGKATVTINTYGTQ